MNSEKIFKEILDCLDKMEATCDRIADGLEELEVEHENELAKHKKELEKAKKSSSIIRNQIRGL